MKKILAILVSISACSVDRLSDRIEIPANQLWEVYTDLHVIEVDSVKRYHLITAIPYGKVYPKYSYQWYDYYDTLRMGDIVSLTDSLRGRITYKRHWKRHKAQ